MTETLAARIRELGSGFVGRLDDSVLESAIEYVDFNEWGLALEMLCDQLYEFEVHIQESELREIETLADEMHLDPKRVVVLRELVIPTD